MPTDLASTLYFIARLLLGGAFVIFGIRNFGNVERLSGVLAGKGLPQPRAIIYLGVAIQLLGGLAVVTGVLATWGAAALIAFLIGAAYLFHDFWAYQGEERAPHENAWLMNLALSGGFLLVIVAAL